MLLHKTLASLIIFAGTLFAVQPATSADLSGRWAGHWENNNNPHKGPLRANLKKINSDQYRATFSGRFFKVIPFRYKVTLDVVEEGPSYVRMSGRSRAGRQSYQYTATSTGNSLVTHYSSKRYQGKFVLKRRR